MHFRDRRAPTRSRAGTARPAHRLAGVAAAAVAVGLTVPAGATAAGPPSFAAGGGFGPTGIQPYSVAIGDLTGDGRPDLATADRDSGSVTVLTKDATGGGYTASTAGTTGVRPSSVAIGDLNGDGRPDLAAANLNSSSVTVLSKNAIGDGYTPSTLGTDRGPASVAIGDLNGDGRPDLATANDPSATVTVLTKDATGDGFTRSTAGSTGDRPLSVAIGDLDGDRAPDLVTADFSANAVTVLRNTTDVTAPAITIDAPTDGATYVQGQAATAAYRCVEEAAGSGAASCVGTVPDGAALPTDTPGPQAFSVTSTDTAGNTATRTVRYTVTPPAAPAGTAPPTTTPPTILVPPTAPTPTTAPAPSPFLRLGRASSSRRGALVTVKLQTSGPGTVEAVATHTRPRRTAGSRALTAGPGRIVYAAAKARRRQFAGTQPLRLRRTAAGRAARFTARTITLRVVTVFTPERGGKPIRRTTNVRARVR
ncbi:unannotated protein [freshwater metagenome]|uniref:Unannotated protein n=1 Tax=freshwater metagenome TaxID=449393 RepID=A0A6J7J1C9_9ZZZZ|nr:hypothetical protein [Actinomycetota bacterium]